MLLLRFKHTATELQLNTLPAYQCLVWLVMEYSSNYLCTTAFNTLYETNTVLHGIKIDNLAADAYKIAE